VLGGDVFNYLPHRSSLSAVGLSDAFPKRFDGFELIHGIKQLLLRCCILNNQLRLTVNREDFGLSCPFQAAQMGFGVALKVREGTDTGEINHTRLNIKFTAI